MIKLFTGSAHKKLSQEIAGIINVPLSRSEIIRFGNSEVRVKINEDVKDKICAVIQPTTNPTDTNYMELFFYCDALKRQEAKKVIGIIPYFGYAKQNIQHRIGESVSVNVIIRFIEAIGFAKIYTIDLHDEATAGVFSIPFKHLSAFPLLAKHIRNYLTEYEGFSSDSDLTEKIALVSPDQGAVEKVRNFGRVFFNQDDFSEVVIEKKRNLNHAHQAKPLDLYGNISGKIALIVDDMVVSGSTIIPAVNLCLERGAKKVYVTVIHHDFTKEAPKLLQTSKLTRFFTTNTIELQSSQIFPKLEEISVAPLIAEEIKKLM